MYNLNNLNIIPRDLPRILVHKGGSSKISPTGDGTKGRFYMLQLSLLQVHKGFHVVQKDAPPLPPS